MRSLKPTAEEVETTAIPDTPWFVEMSERMGEGAVRERLAREKVLRTKMAPLFRFPDGMADRRFAVRVLDSMIRWSRLSRRARRNFTNIRLVDKEWELSGLGPETDGFRILQVSDFHLDFDPGVVGRLRDALNGVEYDAACLTGDFFDLVFEEESMEHSLLEELISLFHGPVYAVLGNHDILAVAESLERLGVRVLMNEAEIPENARGGFWLAGVDDPRQYLSHSFERALRDCEGNLPVVMLAHSPQVYAEASQFRIDLMLCGHTHGGQVRLPGGIVLPHRFNCPRSMVSDDWKFRGLRGYTSRGCGGCKLPYRLNSPAEITVHRLRAG